LVETLDLAAGLWVIRAGADVVDAELAEHDLQGGAPAASWCGGESGSVVGEHRCRVPRWANAVVKVSVTSGPVMVGRAALASATRVWSSSRSRISTAVSGKVAALTQVSTS
jgi:hypothetical protein